MLVNFTSIPENLWSHLVFLRVLACDFREVGSEIDADDITVGEWFNAKVVDVRSLSAAAAGNEHTSNPDNLRSHFLG